LALRSLACRADGRSPSGPKNSMMTPASRHAALFPVLMSRPFPACPERPVRPPAAAPGRPGRPHRRSTPILPAARAGPPGTKVPLRRADRGRRRRGPTAGGPGPSYRDNPARRAAGWNRRRCGRAPAPGGPARPAV
jgi:hypothetical protein